MKSSLRRVPATEFKAKCLELMDRVAERRETFVITKRGKPVAKMGPVDREPKDSIFGFLRGKAWIKGDILSPVVPPEAWEVVEEWRELSALDQPPKGAAKRPRRRAR
jgi:prevent-host-death family protein